MKYEPQTSVAHSQIEEILTKGTSARATEKDITTEYIEGHAGRRCPRVPRPAPYHSAVDMVDMAGDGRPLRSESSRKDRQA